MVLGSLNKGRRKLSSAASLGPEAPLLPGCSVVQICGWLFAWEALGGAAWQCLSGSVAVHIGILTTQQAAVCTTMLRWLCSCGWSSPRRLSISTEYHCDCLLQVSRLQVAELIASVVANPELAENKVKPITAITPLKNLHHPAPVLCSDSHLFLLLQPNISQHHQPVS